MNRVALVTGASRGIGRAIAAELAEAGYAVCVNYLEHRAQAEELAEAIRNRGGSAIAVRADVADRAAVESMARTAEAALGPVTLLVNNAGIAGQIQFQDITDAQWDRYLAVNLGGARNAIQAVLPHMLHVKDGLHRQHLLHLGAAGGLLRGGLCLHQGGADRPDPLPGPGAGPLPHPGQLRGPRGHQHRHGPGPGAGDAAGAGGGDASGPPGHAGGHRPRGGVFRL